jgi:hypothetical protein
MLDGVLICFEVHKGGCGGGREKPQGLKPLSYREMRGVGQAVMSGLPTGSPEGRGRLVVGGASKERFLSSQVDPSRERREGKSWPAPLEMTSVE